MKEIFLLKLGEIVLKGANKRQFEARLRQNVRRRMKRYGNFDVYIMQSTVYIEPMDEEADVDGAWEACRSIFGVVSLCRCRPCEKDVDAIFDAIENYLGDDLDCAKSFKVESKRSDKQFPMTSIQLSQEIGGRLAEAHPGVEVDVHHPEYTVYVEVRDFAAYVHGPAQPPGAGSLSGNPRRHGSHHPRGRHRRHHGEPVPGGGKAPLPVAAPKWAWLRNRVRHLPLHTLKNTLPGLLRERSFMKA